MTKKYVLTDEAKEFVRKVAPTPERAQELIAKAETVFNCEQTDFSATCRKLKSNYGKWDGAYCYLVMNRSDCAELTDVDDWPLTDDEITAIDQKAA